MELGSTRALRLPTGLPRQSLGAAGHPRRSDRPNPLGDAGDVRRLAEAPPRTARFTFTANPAG